MKRIISLALALVLFATSFAFADPVKTEAEKTFQEVLLNGEKVELGAFLINQRNYVKLRDVAALLTETDSKFNVGFDNEKKQVLVTTDVAYEKQENDLTALPEGKQDAVIDTQNFLFNGEEKEVETAVINQNNFLQLRQLGELIGFNVKYNKETKAIELSTVVEKKEEATEKTEEKAEPKLEEQKAITLEGFKGEWVSIHSILAELKTFVKQTAEAQKISEKEVIEKFEKAWNFPAKSFKVEENKITFKMNDDKEIAAEYKHAGFIPRVRDSKVVSYLHLFETEAKDAPKYFVTTEVHHGHAHLYYLGNEKPEKFEGKISIATVLPTTMKVEEMDKMLAEHMAPKKSEDKKVEKKEEAKEEAVEKKEEEIKEDVKEAVEKGKEKVKEVVDKIKK